MTLSLGYKKQRLSKLGVALLVLLLLVSGFSLLMLYSASFYAASHNFGDKFYFLKKQGVACVIGVVAMICLSFVDAGKVRKLALPLLIASYALLAVIFIPGVGVESYGARRWINLGVTTMQPSEIAKFGLILFAASFMHKHDMAKFKNTIPILLAGGAMCVLLLLEPNMSVTILTAGLMIIMLFAGGANYKLFFALIIPLIGLFLVLILSEPYRLQRLMAFVDPWANPKGEGYQLIQSYYALGSGGWFGVGLFNSRQKYMFLPFAESDFIFSIIGEELGFVGAITVIGVYLAISFLGFGIAAKSTGRFESLLCFGVSSVFMLQSLINIAVVSGTIPPTGIPMPLMSYGGSSIVCFFASFGILLSVDRQSKGNTICVGNEYGKLFVNKRWAKVNR